jgi:hypothetical protein
LPARSRIFALVREPSVVDEPEPDGEARADRALSVVVMLAAVAGIAVLSAFVMGLIFLFQLL